MRKQKLDERLELNRPWRSILHWFPRGRQQPSFYPALHRIAVRRRQLTDLLNREAPRDEPAGPLSGFTTQDINRCQTTARACALTYN